MKMTNEELQKMLTSFEEEVSHIKEWHIDRDERIKNATTTETRSKGGKTTIKQLLEWQKKNDFSIGKIEKTEEHKKNIGKANSGKVRNEETKQQISQTIIENNSKLTDEERSKKYSNNSSSNKSLRIRMEVLNLIENDTFITSDARKACKEYGLGNWKGLLGDKRIVKQIHKGTNQHDTSTYEKVKDIK